MATTDSDHDQPIYPNRAKDLAIDGPDQLWVADITYIAIREGFAYVAVILDAWSRRAIGYAITGPLGEPERPVVGVEHHLLGLARIFHEKEQFRRSGRR